VRCQIGVYMSLTFDEAYEKLERNELSTAMLKPLGIGMEVFLHVTQLDGKQELRAFELLRHHVKKQRKESDE